MSTINLPKRIDTRHFNANTDWFSRIIEIGIGTVFVVSGIIHTNNPCEFLNAVLHYEIVFGIWATTIAIILPALEFLVGVCLVTGTARIGALAMSSALLGIFAVAQGAALYRGLEIDCGCFGRYSHRVSAKSVSAVVVVFVLSSTCLLAELRRARK